ncbi:MAG: hypothetical protein MUF01_09070 [Bryobacterales bacterium]|nr:hypothetical protein [Bryobacterales bacterium]
MLRDAGVDAVELSALRANELAPLVDAIPALDLSGFRFTSVHAPSCFSADEEDKILRLLQPVVARALPIVVHPDVIYTPERWRQFGDRLLIENMDKRKPVGRFVHELEPYFNVLLEARFCFDIGHARQVDPTMTEAALLLDAFAHRLAEVHMSEVNTASRHDPISVNAVSAFASVGGKIPMDAPVILESLIDQGQSEIATEIRKAREVFAVMAVAAD